MSAIPFNVFYTSICKIHLYALLVKIPPNFLRTVFSCDLFVKLGRYRERLEFRRTASVRFLKPGGSYKLFTCSWHVDDDGSGAFIECDHPQEGRERAQSFCLDGGNVLWGESKEIAGRLDHL